MPLALTRPSRRRLTYSPFSGEASAKAICSSNHAFHDVCRSAIPLYLQTHGH